MTTSATNEQALLPFLKWAGGKRWLVESHKELFSTDFNTFYEPFLGSGAVYFKLKPKHAVLSDRNSDLINTYTAIRDEWEKVVQKLAEHQKKHSKNYYYYVRDMTPRTKATKAAKFIYLNRTCWNGLYRVNLNGKFNVPIGTKTNVVLDTDDFEKVSKQLETSELRSQDFETIIDEASKNDFIFVDPPYTVKHNTNGFIKYNEGLFSWEDQIRLKEAVKRAQSRGCKVLVTNAAHDCIRELYDGVGEFRTVSRSSVISGKASGRGVYDEAAIVCF